MKNLLLLFAICLPLQLQAEILMFDKYIDKGDEEQEEQRANGVIGQIDLVGRYIDLDGYRYYLPGATDPEPLIVKLLGRGSGSLQLLKEGMTVEIFFIQVEDVRLGYEIVQLDDQEPT